MTAHTKEIDHFLWEQTFVYIASNLATVFDIGLRNPIQTLWKLLKFQTITRLPCKIIELGFPVKFLISQSKSLFHS